MLVNSKNMMEMVLASEYYRARTLAGLASSLNMWARTHIQLHAQTYAFLGSGRCAKGPSNSSLRVESFIQSNAIEIHQKKSNNNDDDGHRRRSHLSDQRPTGEEIEWGWLPKPNEQ